MADINYLWIGLVMGLFLIVVATVFGPIRDRTSTRYRSPRGRLGGESEPSSEHLPGVLIRVATLIDNLVAFSRQPISWMLAFVVLAIGIAGIGIFAVGGFGAPEDVAGTAGPILIAVFLVLLAGYVLLGTYVSARRRGHPNAHALAESLGVLSLLIVAAVAGRLLFL